MTTPGSRLPRWVLCQAAKAACPFVGGVFVRGTAFGRHGGSRSLLRRYPDLFPALAERTADIHRLQLKSGA